MKIKIGVGIITLLGILGVFIPSAGAKWSYQINDTQDGNIYNCDFQAYWDFNGGHPGQVYIEAWGDHWSYGTTDVGCTYNVKVGCRSGASVVWLGWGPGRTVSPGEFSEEHWEGGGTCPSGYTVSEYEVGEWNNNFGYCYRSDISHDAGVWTNSCG